MTTSTRTNAIATDDLRALCGPVPHEGKLLAVVKDGDQWRYQVSSIDPRQKPEVSEGFTSPEAARQALAQKCQGPERQAWENDPFTTLPAGQGWYRQRVGGREIRAEAVFVRACHLGNVDLARAAADKVTNINAHDAAGNTLLMHATRVPDSRELMDNLLNKGADPRRANEQGFTPAHVAAGMESIDRLRGLVRNGASVHAISKEGETPLLMTQEKNRKGLQSNAYQGPRPNPNKPGGKLPPLPAVDKSRSRERDVRSF